MVITLLLFFKELHAIILPTYANFAAGAQNLKAALSLLNKRFAIRAFSNVLIFHEFGKPRLTSHSFILNAINSIMVMHSARDTKDNETVGASRLDIIRFFMNSLAVRGKAKTVLLMEFLNVEVKRNIPEPHPVIFVDKLQKVSKNYVFIAFWAAKRK